MKNTKLNLCLSVIIGLAGLFTLSLSVASLKAEETGAGDPQKKIERPEDLTIPYILDRINSVGPYDKPDLPLKLTKNYANTSVDDEPYGAVKPYKEHFLVQMEYAGAGRAIPEPENLDSVKIGFLGPIMPTVSMATGGARVF